MKRKILYLFLALALLASLAVSLFTVSPAGAAATLQVKPAQFAMNGTGTAQWINTDSHTGSYSVSLSTSLPGDFAAFGYQGSFGPIDSIQSLSMWYKDIVHTQLSGPNMVVAFLYNNQPYLAGTTCAVPSFNWKQADAINGTGADWYPTGGGNAIWTYGPWDGQNYLSWIPVNWGAFVPFSIIQTNFSGASVYGVAVLENIVNNQIVFPGTALVDDIEINGITYYGMIQDAIDAASAGDTISVAAGNYNENIVIDKPLTVQGAGMASTFINGIGTGTNVTAVNIIAAGDVTLSGFTITNAPVTNNTDLRFGVLTNSPTAGVTYTITNNTVIGTNNPDAEQDYGIYGQNGGKENLVITNNVVTQTGSNNIVIETHQGTTDISYNTIDAGCYGADAIFVMTHSGKDVSNLQRVSNNTIDMSTGLSGTRATGISFCTVAGTYGVSPARYLWNSIQITDNDILNLSENRRGIGFWNDAAYGSDGNILLPLVAYNTITAVSGVPAGSMGIDTVGLVSGAFINNNEITGTDFCYKEREWNGNIANGTRLHFNSFVSSGGSGVVTERTTGTLNAKCNWWGAASGPGPVGPGSGVNVSANVDYSPWQIAQGANCGYTINASVSGGHGSVSPATQTVDLYGADASIQINYDSGYRVASITDNGNPVTIAFPYVISGVTEDHNVVVTFTNIPNVPFLTSPGLDATGVAVPVTFTWEPSPLASSYWLEVNSDSGWTTNGRVYYAAVTGTSQQVSGLSTGTTYYWRVWAYGAGGWSPASNRSFTTAVPAAPNLINPAAGATDVAVPVTFSWASYSGASSYWLEVNSNSGFAPGATRVYYAAVTGTSQQVTGLSGNTIYYWRVWAYVAGYWTPAANRSFTTMPILGLAPPTLTYPAAGATDVTVPVTFTWAAFSGASSYWLEVNSDSGFAPGATRVYYAAVTGTSQQVTGLSGNTIYYWRVWAYVAGYWSPAANRSFTTAAPAVPNLINPAAGATGVAVPVTFSWAAFSGASSYWLEVNSDSGFAPGATRVYYAAVTGTSQQVTGLSGNTIYYWRVWAYGAGVWSPAANRSFTTAVPAVPNLINPAAGATGVAVPVTFTWAAFSGASSYWLEVNSDSGFAPGATRVYYASVTGTSQQVTGLSRGTTYYWRVWAYVAGVWTPAANRSFTTAP